MASRRRNPKKTDDTLVDIVEVRDQAQSFMERNQNLVFGLLVAVVVIVGGLFAYNNFYKLPRQQEAVEQMVQAQVQFERDSFALALANPGGGYPGFLDIADNYSGTRAGNLANYYVGVSYLHLGQYEAALEYLRDFSPAGQITPIMKFGAMGDAYAELGEMDDALSYYQRAADAEDNSVLTPYYLKKVGMLHERREEWDAAEQAYQQIKNRYPESMVAGDIDKYLARAQRQGE